jgi:futalosine hydrolase
VSPDIAPTTLVLVPTQREHARLVELGGFAAPGTRVERCGFGPVAAAARTAELLARLRPRRALLVGIGGSFEPAELPVGSARTLAAVRLEGVGVGRDGRPLAPSELGLPQWCGPPGEVHEELELAGAGSGLLLTVCAASADVGEADRRRADHPAARVEDMEGFGVALACHLAGVRLTVVRGISNRAGERDPRRWDIAGALAAARHEVLGHLAEPAGGVS